MTLRWIISIMLPFASLSVAGQLLNKRFLHYRTDTYWDTTLVSSHKPFYFENNKGLLTERAYPVLQYMHSDLKSDTPGRYKMLFPVSQYLYSEKVSDSPEVYKHYYEPAYRESFTYRYIKKHENVFLKFYDSSLKKNRLHKQFTINPSDTVSPLIDLNTINSLDGVSAGDNSVFKGGKTLYISDVPYKTLHFLVFHEISGADDIAYTEDIFLEVLTLIPIRYILAYYKHKPGDQPRYTITTLESSSDTLPDFKNKTKEDLIIYRNENKTWTEAQKQWFIKTFPDHMKSYAECLIQNLDGRVSVFNLRQNPVAREIMSSEKCK